MLNGKPLCIELFAGLHGWGEGFIAEGWEVVGFDLFDMATEIGIQRNRDCHLVIQDVLTLDGSQFRNADCLVASPPCQEYSLWGMRMFHPNPPLPNKALWQAALRIHSETGRNIPMIIENVRGAQYHWGRAAWKCGPYYLWGDVPALMPRVPIKRKNVVDDVKNGVRRGLQVNARSESGSIDRKRVTAVAAKIPFALAQHIARVYKPEA